MAIHFYSEDITFKPQKIIILKNWLKSVIENENRKVGEINIVFCSDNFLLNLNEAYLRHHTLTDIITFQYSEPADISISGEIFISIERVRENAILFNTTFSNELHRVIVHGVLHLLGHKDKTKPQKTNMHLKEDNCLSLLPQL